MGPLHGIPVIVKDQADVKGMPTTLGSLLFKDYYPDRDSFVAEKLRKAGAVFLGKATLGELGGGDTHGSLFGSTRNPYDTERTVGGSSGGSAAAVAANYSTLAIGQEGLASIRRPSTWNCIAGMRPSAGLVSRSGVYGCWPELFGSLGPMARTVKDLALCWTPWPATTRKIRSPRAASATRSRYVYQVFKFKTDSKARASASCASPSA